MSYPILLFHGHVKKRKCCLLGPSFLPDYSIVDKNSSPSLVKDRQFFALLFTFQGIITDLSAPVTRGPESAWFPEGPITITSSALFKHSKEL